MFGWHVGWLENRKSEVGKKMEGIKSTGEGGTNELDWSGSGRVEPSHK